MKLSEIMASGDIGVRSLPGCWRGHRLNKHRKKRRKKAFHPPEYFFTTAMNNSSCAQARWVSAGLNLVAMFDLCSRERTAYTEYDLSSTVHYYLNSQFRRFGLHHSRRYLVQKGSGSLIISEEEDLLAGTFRQDRTYHFPQKLN